MSISVIAVYIYTICNSRNGRMYVGSSTNTVRRFARHKYDIKHHIHHNSEIRKDSLLYSSSDFIFNIVETCNSSNRAARENYWMLKLGTLDLFRGYNRQTSCSYTHSDQTRQLISDSRSQPVSKYDPATRQLVTTYRNMKEAADSNGTYYPTISVAISKDKAYKGYKYRKGLSPTI